MPKERILREIRWDINPDKTVAGRFATFDIFFVEGEGEEAIRTPLPKETEEAKLEDLAEFFEQTVAESDKQCQEAHATIAGMQASVREKDALISAKDVYIERLIAGIAQLSTLIVSYVSGTTKANEQIAEAQSLYNQAILDAPKARVQ